MSLVDNVYLRQHRRLRSQLEVNIAKRAFAGSSMEIIHSGEGFEKLDEETRDRLLAFSQDILACECEGAPFCGHPEERFVRYVLELREQGLDPDAVVGAMGADYHLDAYPGDVLSFLDEAVRLLEAIEAIAAVDEANHMQQRARARRAALEGGT